MKVLLFLGFSIFATSAYSHDLALKETKVEIGGKETIALSMTGKVLYTFEEDIKGKESVCTGKCAEIWPPILLTAEEVKELNEHKGEVEVYKLDGSETDKSGFGILVRNGLNQLTYNGWPLYYYAYDRSEDDAYGDEHNPTGVDEWYALTADFEDHD